MHELRTGYVDSNEDRTRPYGHADGRGPDAGDPEQYRSLGDEGRRGPGDGATRAELLWILRADHRQRPRARGPRRVLHARRLRDSDDGARGDDAVRWPRVAHSLLDVPQGADPGARAGGEGSRSPRTLVRVRGHARGRVEPAQGPRRVSVVRRFTGEVVGVRRRSGARGRPPAIGA